MKKRVSQKKEKKISKKGIKDKVEIISIKKEIPKKDFIAELDANGIISSVELNQILKSERKLSQLENIPVRGSLEGSLIFAPRIKDRKDAEGKLYSENLYDPKYIENKYGEKTPGEYAGKTSSEKESSKGSDTNGNE
jgi:hypothetical protein